MSYGIKQVFSCGIASGASTSSFIDLGDKSFHNMALQIVTMSTGAAVTVWGGVTSGTFYPVMERVNTAPVQHQTLVVATTTSGNWTMMDAVPFRYLLFTASAVVSGGASITVVAQD